MQGRSVEQDGFQDDEEGHFGSLSEIPNVPWPAVALGAAGLIPFIALAPPIDAYLPEVHAVPYVLWKLALCNLIRWMSKSNIREGFVWQALFYGMHVQAQAAYGAVILTFVGATHWGLAMADYAGCHYGEV